MAHTLNAKKCHLRFLVVISSFGVSPLIVSQSLQQSTNGVMLGMGMMLMPSNINSNR